MDDFFLRAMLGGIGVAVITGPLGCVVVWRRMAYFGAALSHAALLGVALGFVLDINLTLGVVIVCLALALGLSALERHTMLTSDSLLGIMAHAMLALGLVTLSFMQHLRVDLMGYLFGDVLAISWTDIYLIGILAATTLALLISIWRALLSLTVNPDLARVEGVNVERVRLCFVLMLAMVIAIGMKVVGILLVVSLLIIPAASARMISRTPEQMAIIAAGLGVLSVALGLSGSWHWDVPAGPMIVVVAGAVFLICVALPRFGNKAVAL